MHSMMYVVGGEIAQAVRVLYKNVRRCMFVIPGFPVIPWVSIKRSKRSVIILVIKSRTNETTSSSTIQPGCIYRTKRASNKGEDCIMGFSPLCRSRMAQDEPLTSLPQGRRPARTRGSTAPETSARKISVLQHPGSGSRPDCDSYLNDIELRGSRDLTDVR